MNALINQNLRAKRIIHRFISLLPIVEKSSVVKPTNYEKQSPSPVFGPLDIFNSYRTSTRYTVKNTGIIHAHLLTTGLLHTDIFVSNSLLDCYCKSADMFRAVRLFDEIPEPNKISWNIVISGYNYNSQFEDSWGFFCRMRFLGFEPDEIAYRSVFSACAALHDPLMFGKQVYSLAVKNGFYSNGYVRTGMIDLFVKNDRFENAFKVFYDVLSCDNVVCWSSIISGAVSQGKNRVALDLFGQMCRKSLLPSSFTFASVLTACSSLEDKEFGKGVHGWVIKCCAKNVFVDTALVDLYAKCGDIREAVKEFSRMSIRNVVSWTAIISACVKKDDSISALGFFREMREEEVEINNFTATSILSACAKPDMIKEAIQIHCWILKTRFYLDPIVGAALISMYSKIGAVDLSEMVFQEVKDIKHSHIWASMVSAFAQNQSAERAIQLLQIMLNEGLRPDKFCCATVLSVIDHLDFGRQIHCYTLKTGFILDLSVGTCLSTMYSKCNALEDSFKMFKQIPSRDLFLWGSMIAGFAEHGCADQAFWLFRHMLSEEYHPDQMTLNAMLTACSGLRSLQKGKEIHAYACRLGVLGDRVVGGALVTMYSKCGNLEFARKIFDMLPEKDHVSCSSLVSGYTQNGLLEEAVVLFDEMLRSSLPIDSFTISSVLGAIALLNRLDTGTQLHARVTKVGLDSNVAVGTSLVTMYSKSGSIEDCCKAFDQIDEPDLISWTTMIANYARYGKGTEALRTYDQMRMEGIRPDSVTFVGLLSACSHSNLVDEGYYHFNSMSNDFGIDPNNQHYACMVDILGRSGRLEEAEKFISSMPIEPDGLVWGTLLAFCKVHGDMELGRLAAQKVMELEPRDSGSFVSLSNICADAGDWEQVVQIRNLMSGTGVRKEPAWSYMSKSEQAA